MISSAGIAATCAMTASTSRPPGRSSTSPSRPVQPGHGSPSRRTCYIGRLVSHSRQCQERLTTHGVSVQGRQRGCATSSPSSPSVTFARLTDVFLDATSRWPCCTLAWPRLVWRAVHRTHRGLPHAVDRLDWVWPDGASHTGRPSVLGGRPSLAVRRLCGGRHAWRMRRPRSGCRGTRRSRSRCRCRPAAGPAGLVLR